MFCFKKKKAQSTLEYAIVLAVIVGALIAMQIYMKRGMEGRLRSSSDDIGEQFDPHKTSSSFTATRGSTTKEETASGVTTTHMGIGGGQSEVQKRSGSETVEAW